MFKYTLKTLNNHHVWQFVHKCQKRPKEICFSLLGKTSALIWRLRSLRFQYLPYSFVLDCCLRTLHFQYLPYSFQSVLSNFHRHQHKSQQRQNLSIFRLSEGMGASKYMSQKKKKKD